VLVRETRGFGNGMIPNALQRLNVIRMRSGDNRYAVVDSDH
jgi:hypothetical protein